MVRHRGRCGVDTSDLILVSEWLAACDGADVALRLHESCAAPPPQPNATDVECCAQAARRGLPRTWTAYLN